MNVTARAASGLIEVTPWPGVTTHTTARGAMARVFERHEFGPAHAGRPGYDR